MNLQTKIIAALIPFVVAPLLILGVIAYTQLRTTAEETSTAEMKTGIRQLANSLNTLSATVRANLALFAGSHMLSQYLGTEDEWERYYLLQPPLFREFSTYHRVYPEYREFRVFLQDGTEDLSYFAGAEGSAFPREHIRGFIEAAMASSEAVYSRYTIDPESGAAVLLAACPVRLRLPETEPVRTSIKTYGYLMLAVSLERMQEQFAATKIGVGGFVLAADSTGAILLPSRARQRGSRLPVPFFQHLRHEGGDETPVVGDYLGTPFYLLAERSADGLFIVAGVPEKERRSSTTRLAAATAGITLAAIVLAATLLVGFLRSLLVRPITTLRNAVEEFGRGNLTAEIPASGRDEVGDLARAFQEMSVNLLRSNNQLQTAIDEKEILLREIHHRVKNNMAVVSSLLNLQAREAKDEGVARVLEDSQNRIRAMALIHETLYKADNLAKVGLEEYTRGLVVQLLRMFGAPQRHIEFSVEAPGVELSVNQAVPCGLIINELVTNALKYAFVDRARGRIRIAARRTGEGVVEMIVEDEGRGFPEDLNWREATTLGLRLISLMVAQIDGTWELRHGNGTTVVVRWPAKKNG